MQRRWTSSNATNAHFTSLSRWLLRGRARGSKSSGCVDQAEEVFTLCRDEHERGRFLDNLLYAARSADGRSVVVLTLRADFYPGPRRTGARRAGEQQFLVSPMDEQGLRQAIEEPARRVGLELESGLVGTILDDVGASRARCRSSSTRCSSCGNAAAAG